MRNVRGHGGCARCHVGRALTPASRARPFPSSRPPSSPAHPTPPTLATRLVSVSISRPTSHSRAPHSGWPSSVSWSWPCTPMVSARGRTCARLPSSPSPRPPRDEVIAVASSFTSTGLLSAPGLTSATINAVMTIACRRESGSVRSQTEELSARGRRPRNIYGHWPRLVMPIALSGGRHLRRAHHTTSAAKI